MRTVLTKAAKLLLALVVPTIFMVSCNDDAVEPQAVTPPKGTISTPK